MDDGWKGTAVRNKDGRGGTIRESYVGFLHLGIVISVSDGSQSHVQLNANGPDSGAPGWQWLCANFSGGPAWLPLGDHSGREVEPALPRPGEHR